jgi:hypothetical protein
MKTGTVLLLLVLNIVVLFVWLLTEKKLMLIENPAVLAVPYRYQNPLVISEAVLYFMLFKRVKIKNSRIISCKERIGEMRRKYFMYKFRCLLATCSVCKRYSFTHLLSPSCMRTMPHKFLR